MPQHRLTKDRLWRGILYPAGDCLIPADLATALGLSGTPDSAPTILQDMRSGVLREEALSQPNPQPIAETLSAALQLINGSDKPTDLEIIPTVGRGAAKKLLTKRPEGGYASLGQVQELCPEIFQPPFTGDLDAIAAWGAE